MSLLTDWKLFQLWNQIKGTNMLSDEQVGATARVVVGYGITYAVGKGWLTPADAAPVTSALIAAVVPVVHIGYILYTMTKAKVANKALNTVAALPPTTPAIAKAAAAASEVPIVKT